VKNIVDVMLAAAFEVETRMSDLKSILRELPEVPNIPGHEDEN
jgi:hypothetical protein